MSIYTLNKVTEWSPSHHVNLTLIKVFQAYQLFYLTISFRLKHFLSFAKNCFHKGKKNCSKRTKCFYSNISHPKHFGQASMITCSSCGICACKENSRHLTVIIYVPLDVHHFPEKYCDTFLYLYLLFTNSRTKLCSRNSISYCLLITILL